MISRTMALPPGWKEAVTTATQEVTVLMNERWIEPPTKVPVLTLAPWITKPVLSKMEKDVQLPLGSFTEKVAKRSLGHRSDGKDLALYFALRKTTDVIVLEEFEETAASWRASKPVTHVSYDVRERIHHDSGPALILGDDEIRYYLAGIEVPDWVVLHPERITTDLIRDQRNLEVRARMMQRYRHGEAISGAIAYLKDSNAELIHAEPGRRWLYSLTELVNGRQVVTRVVEVINSSPEPDGTYRHYHLNVPPHVTTCHEAVAATFGLRPNEYHPTRES